MNSYEQFNKKYGEKFNNIPIYYAFNKEQLENVKQKLGIKSDVELEKNVTTFLGGYILNKDMPKLKKHFEEKNNERQKLIDEDTTGEHFVRDMFYTELNNHEYCYTQSIDDTLNALGLTIEEIYTTPNLTRGLSLAVSQIENELTLFYNDFYKDIAEKMDYQNYIEEDYTNFEK